MPFLNNTTENKIRKLFRAKGINIRLYRRSNSLHHTLKPKFNNIPQQCEEPNCPINNSKTCMKRNVVYEVKCNNCNAKYVGYTGRKLHTRIQEHFEGRSSTIHQHLTTCTQGNVQIKILASHKNPINAQLAEATLIKRLKPQLNQREENIYLF